MSATGQPITIQKFLPLSKAIALLPPQSMSHEQFIAAIRELATARLDHKEDAERLNDCKLTYGCADGVRGITYFSAWQNGTAHDLVTVSTIGEESPLQLCGTTLHELGHVLAGPSAGHGKEWRAACRQLGLARAEAAGQAYALEHFDSDVQTAIAALTHPTDGKPVFGNYSGALPVATTFRPCPLGIGTRGGTSRGKGSGSRMRKYVCDCGVIIRAASDTLQAHCDRCGTEFIQPSVGGAA